MLKDLHKWLAAQNEGIETFRAFQRKCMAGLEPKGEHAAFRQLLADAAGRFVDGFEDQPLPADTAKAAREKLLRLTEAAATAGSRGADEQIRALNEIAGARLG